MRARGFTLIELLVVLAAVALLLGLTLPRYIAHLDRAREAALRQNLATLRDAIDKFHADRERYPQGLQELVGERYLRAVPLDPMTDRPDTWKGVAPSTGGDAWGDVRSGAAGTGSDGRPYGAW